MKYSSQKHSESMRHLHSRNVSRNGYGIIEVIVCMIMLASLATWLIPLLNIVITKRAELFERARLQQITMNIVEKLSVSPYDSSTFQTRSNHLIESARTSKAALTLTAGNSSPQGLRRIDLTVTPLEPGKTIRPIKLTTWIQEAANAN